MGTHLRVFRESYLMNTNTLRFRWFSKILAPLYCALDESSLSIGRVKPKLVYQRILGRVLSQAFLGLRLVKGSHLVQGYIDPSGAVVCVFQNP